MESIDAGEGAVEEEASLRRIFAILRARWRLLVLGILPVLLTTGVYAAALPPAHTATVVVFFAPGEGAYAGSDFSRLIAPYELTAISSETRARAEQEAGLAAGSLGSEVSVDRSSDGLGLVVSVTAPDPSDSTAAALSIAGSVTEAANDDARANAWNVSDAGVGGDETPLRRMIVIATGLLLAPLPGAFLALWLDAYRPRVRLPDDARTAGAPVLLTLARRRIPRANLPDRSVREWRPSVQLWLLIDAALHGRAGGTHVSEREVVIAGVDANDDGALRIATVLESASNIVRSTQAGGRSALTFRAAPWDMTGPPADALDQPCVLVIPEGFPQDRLRAIIALVQNQGGRILGSVLLLA